jgi:hypothetical protein
LLDALVSYAFDFPAGNTLKATIDRELRVPARSALCALRHPLCVIFYALCAIPYALCTLRFAI